MRRGQLRVDLALRITNKVISKQGDDSMQDSVSRGVVTRRIRRRAALFNTFKAEALAVQTHTLDSALAFAAEKGKTPADVRAMIVDQLGQCWRNLASRKREVRVCPHMRSYHTRFAVGEMAVIRKGQRMLAEFDSRFAGPATIAIAA
jgi:hypothetical protein